MPSAETMSRSSTPARTILPKRVRLISHHSPTPISERDAEHDHAAEEAEADVAGRSTVVGQSVGVLMSFEMPPNAASIWSAKITESAIVISAWRRSWPWFQRRNTCWMTTPITPMIAVASSSGMSQPSRRVRPSSSPDSEQAERRCPP